MNHFTVFCIAVVWLTPMFYIIGLLNRIQSVEQRLEHSEQTLSKFKRREFARRMVMQLEAGSGSGIYDSYYSKFKKEAADFLDGNEQ